MTFFTLPARRSRRTRLLGVTLALCVLTAAPTATTAVATGAPGAAARAGTPGVAPAVHTITLVTGDVVRMMTLADGRQTAAVVPDPNDPVPGAVIRRVDGDLQVIPREALPWLAAGRLDPDLFNVTDLVAQGYDDAHAEALPLIVAYTGGTIARAAAAHRTGASATTAPPARSAAGAPRPVAPSGSRIAEALPSLGAAAVVTPKVAARSFWSSLDRPLPEQHADARSALSAGYRGGVAALWLDGRVQATLDSSVPQIGAPAAHARGLDGRGVTVAVLDTGVDTRHGDLAGRVTRQANFTEEATGSDGHGHGTHVAATVGGSGAASDGRYRGVAPGAELWAGKVLDAYGEGSESWVLAGMEWAASGGADIVSMSLGGSPSDGTDPMSLAVDALTAQYDSLFVIAAGNDGMDESVTAPATADTALTVGAVDRGDVLADFSSRGPRLGDGAVKPEITAPGVDIVAAQARGTELGEVVAPGYVALSGTSMATPHVSGAAAILAQQHPDWDAAMLKAALVASAVASPDTSVFAQGAGRVDVAAATQQSVTVDASTLNLGAYDWPHGDDAPVTRSLTYTNRAAAPVTLQLAAQVTDGRGQAPAAEALTVSHPELSLAPGASGSVQVVLHPDQAGIGSWGGTVTATDVATGRQTRSAVGFVKESERYEVTVRVLDRSGEPAAFPIVDLVNLDTGEMHSSLDMSDPGLSGPEVSDPEVAAAELTFRVAPGTWSVMGTVDETGQARPGLSLLVTPELVVRQPSTVVLDARAAVPVRFSLPVRGQEVVTQVDVALTSESAGFGLGLLAEGDQPVFVTPARSPGNGQLDFSAGTTVRAPELLARVVARRPVRLSPRVLGGAELLEGQRTVTVVSVGDASRPKDVEGRWVLVRVPVGEPVDAQVRSLSAAGAAGIMVWTQSADRDYWLEEAPDVPVISVSRSDAWRLVQLANRGTVRTTLTQRRDTPYLYTIQEGAQQEIPRDLHFSYATSDLARINHTFRSHGVAENGITYTVPQPDPGEDVWMGMAIGTETSLGTTRTDWVSTGSQWAHTLEVGTEVGGDVDEEWTYTEPVASWEEPARRYTAGRTTSSTWLGQLVRPADGTGDWSVFPVREGNQLWGYLSPWTDSSGRISYPTGSDRVQLRLSRDGERILTSAEPWLDGVVLPAAGHRYELVLDARKEADSWRRSTRTVTKWEFGSARTSRRNAVPLPLLSLDARVPVGLDNSTTARSVSFLVTGRMPDAAPAARLTALTVSASFDGGRTWRPAAKVVRQNHTTYSVRIDHPAGARSVSLRTSATDASGSTIRQDVIDAYGVRAAG